MAAEGPGSHFQRMNRSTLQSALPRFVGEFITIVLGVLVALGVDQWRESRAEVRLEMDYYESLLGDLDRDISEYEVARDFIAVSIQAAEQVRSEINGVPASEPFQTVAQAIQYASWVNYPAWSSGTMDELVNSGSIRLLRDPELKRETLAYYDAISEWKPRLQGSEFSAFIDYRSATAALVAMGPDTWTNERTTAPAEAFAAMDSELRRSLVGNQPLLGLTQEMIWQWAGLEEFMERFHDQAVELRGSLRRHLDAHR